MKIYSIEENTEIQNANTKMNLKCCQLLRPSKEFCHDSRFFSKYVPHNCNSNVRQCDIANCIEPLHRYETIWWNVKLDLRIELRTKNRSTTTKSFIEHDYIYWMRGFDSNSEIFAVIRSFGFTCNLRSMCVVAQWDRKICFTLSLIIRKNFYIYPGKKCFI